MYEFTYFTLISIFYAYCTDFNKLMNMAALCMSTTACAVQNLDMKDVILQTI